MPEVCELSGLESYSVWIATTGWPEPKVAQKPVGNPEMPRSTLKPPSSSSAVISFAVSNSCMPSSAK